MKTMSLKIKVLMRSPIGSATEKKQSRLKKGAVRVNKREMIESSTRATGEAFLSMATLKQEQYNTLAAVEDAPQFSLNHRVFLAKVVRVTDGDTIKAVLFLHGVPTRFVFRVSGVDTPQCRKGEAKQFGKKVKQILSSLIEGKIVKMQAGDFDKYGRILTRIYASSEGRVLCINDFLIKESLAKAYAGKTKVEFTSSDEDEFLKTLKNRSWPKIQHFPRE